MALEQFAARDPAGFIRWFASGHGLIPQQSAGQAQAGADPAEAAAMRDAERAVADFASRPGFAELRSTMARLLEDGRAASLDEAYQKALDAYPKVKAKAEAAQKEEAAAERRKVEAAKLRKAMRAEHRGIFDFENRIDDVARSIYSKISPRRSAA